MATSRLGVVQREFGAVACVAGAHSLLPPADCARKNLSRGGTHTAATLRRDARLAKEGPREWCSLCAVHAPQLDCMLCMTVLHTHHRLCSGPRPWLRRVRRCGVVPSPHSTHTLQALCSPCRLIARLCEFGVDVRCLFAAVPVHLSPFTPVPRRPHAHTQATVHRAWPVSASHGQAMANHK